MAGEILALGKCVSAPVYPFVCLVLESARVGEMLGARTK